MKGEVSYPDKTTDSFVNDNFYVFREKTATELNDSKHFSDFL
jgi:hypothetical protein